MAFRKYVYNPQVLLAWGVKHSSSRIHPIVRVRLTVSADKGISLFRLIRGMQARHRCHVAPWSLGANRRFSKSGPSDCLRSETIGLPTYGLRLTFRKIRFHRCFFEDTSSIEKRFWTVADPQDWERTATCIIIKRRKLRWSNKLTGIVLKKILGKSV